MSEQRTEAVSDRIYKCPACDGYNLKRSKENPAVCHDCHDDGTPKTMTEAVSEEARMNGNGLHCFACGQVFPVTCKCREPNLDWRNVRATLSPRVQSGDGEVERDNRLHYRHKKRGTVYERIGVAELQAATGLPTEGDSLTIYRGEDGRLWARPTNEFHDGRFEQVWPARAAIATIDGGEGAPQVGRENGK